MGRGEETGSRATKLKEYLWFSLAEYAALLEESLRIREQSQIPVVPRAVQWQLDELKKHHETEHKALEAIAADLSASNRVRKLARTALSLDNYMPYPEVEPGPVRPDPSATFVNGIGPPLEQLEQDYQEFLAANGPDPNAVRGGRAAADVLALIRAYWNLQAERKR